MEVHSALLDHVVLAVSDLAASTHWWAQVTGATPAHLPGGDVSLRVGPQAIRLRAGTPAPFGSVTVCLVTDASIHDLYDRIEQLHLRHDKVAPITGAGGPLQAISLQDPDGYFVELSTYIADTAAARAGFSAQGAG